MVTCGGDGGGGGGGDDVAAAATMVRARACVPAASVRARVLVSEYDNVRGERCPLFALFRFGLSLSLHLSLRVSLSLFFVVSLSLMISLPPSLSVRSFVSRCLGGMVQRAGEPIPFDGQV